MNIEDLKCCVNCRGNGIVIGVSDMYCIRLVKVVRPNGCCEHWEWDRLNVEDRHIETTT